ncbi:MAG TPA: DNA-binding protein, partial [Candidatus Angelobacter sp.]|nr:DNA-binding protein [Candidatus Angelobacter sp.]
MAVATREPITIQAQEQPAVEKLEQLLNRGIPSLVTTSGEKIRLPATVYEILKRAVALMAGGKAVSLIP